jgi:hypothetical protein
VNRLVGRPVATSRTSTVERFGVIFLAFAVVAETSQSPGWLEQQTPVLRSESPTAIVLPSGDHCGESQRFPPS